MWRTEINKDILDQYSSGNVGSRTKVIIEVTEYSFKEYYICEVFFSKEENKIYFNLEDNWMGIKEIDRFMFLKDLATLK